MKILFKNVCCFIVISHCIFISRKMEQVFFKTKFFIRKRFSTRMILYSQEKVKLKDVLSNYI